MPNVPGTPPVVPTVPTTPVVGSRQPQLPGMQTSQIPFGNKQAVFRRIQFQTVRSGALATFQYLFYKHDPNPLVLITGIWADNKIAGVNLHYLTLRYMRFLVNQYCGKPFSYQAIKGDQFIRNSFRCYKRPGIRNLKLLDCEFLSQVVGKVRSFSPNELAATRQYVQDQLKQKLGQTAADLKAQSVSQEFSNMLNPQGIQPGIARPDGRTNPQV